MTNCTFTQDETSRYDDSENLASKPYAKHVKEYLFGKNVHYQFSENGFDYWYGQETEYDRICTTQIATNGADWFDIHVTSCDGQMSKDHFSFWVQMGCPGRSDIKAMAKSQSIGAVTLVEIAAAFALERAQQNQTANDIFETERKGR